MDVFFVTLNRKIYSLLLYLGRLSLYFSPSTWVPSLDEYAFNFLDPAQVIRGAHIIPAFSAGHTSTLLPVTKTEARILNPDEEEDWVNIYVNIFVDRDMLMRHFGQGVGQLKYERQHDIDPLEAPEGDNNLDDDDTSKTEDSEDAEEPEAEGDHHHHVVDKDVSSDGDSESEIEYSDIVSDYSSEGDDDSYASL